MVRLVGDEESLNRGETLLGNSVKELNETHFIPLFIGILLGIVVGTMPIAFPGLPQPVRLGLPAGRSSWRSCSDASDASDGSCATCR